YYWCKFRNESEASYGLKWFMTRESKIYVTIALIITLVPLTVIALHWPVKWGGPLPKHPGLWQALDWLGGGVAAAFIEETFYRGWLQTLLTRRTGAFIAIVITSLIFALSHLIALTGWLRVATFFPGIIMGYLRFKGGSVMPAIIYHALCNIWAVWWAPVI
ncbi:MAG: CPBP family intramembrane metalloprotease, partial [Synergistaceae bacterium]|nr:CPBP family intramembrane metalloprotease [Synergistaceae bacterium]